MSLMASSDLEPILDRFEEAWAGPMPPRIDDFLAQASVAGRTRLLLHLARIDLERRLARGESLRIEEAYLARFPELAGDPEAVASLAAWEYVVRRRSDPHVSPQEYFRRFPQCTEALAHRLQEDARPTWGAGPAATPAAVSFSPLTPPALPARLADYELLDRLGEGGMGMVYRARHVWLEKEFALKVLAPRWAGRPDLLARFLREVRAVGRLEHPNLVRATDAGEANGAPYLVMELLQGEDLGTHVARQGPLAVADAAEALRQAALGLQHAHAAGLVHRDIKPANLFRTTAGVVKILDLGLARLREAGGEEEALTEADTFMGTPDYAAPEQILDSHTADARADLYSLGCTLFHLLSGSPPFSDAFYPTSRHKRQAHLTEPPPDLAARRPDLPAGLTAILTRLLAKQPQDRYATAAEVADALAPFAVGHQLGSPPPQHSSSAPRWGHPPETTPRSALWRWAAAGLAGAILAIAVALWWLGQSTPQPQPPVSPPREPLSGLLDLRVLRPNALEPRWRWLHQPGVLPLRQKDEVRVFVTLNRPAYIYLLWIDTTGQAGPMYPWVEGNWQRRPAHEEPVPKLQLPLDKTIYRIEPGPPGLETLLLLARDEPLPAEEHLEQRLSNLGPQQGRAPAEAAWFRDWELVRDEPDRGPLLHDLPGSSHPAEQVQQELQRRLAGLFTFTRAVCFGNEGGQN